MRWFAEGERAGVLVRRDRWRVLARFTGPDAARLAEDLARVIGRGGLVLGADLPEA